MKKKLLVIIMTLILVLSACSGVKKEELGNKDSKESQKTLKIGILQFIEHPSLDKAREGFVAYLNEKGIKVEIDYKSAQGDIGVARTIAEKFVADKVDLIYAIATPAAEVAAAASTDIPILFSAVTDPLDAKLVDDLQSPKGNISGTSDSVDIKSLLSIFGQIDKTIKKIGIIYSADESNSIVQVDSAKKAAGELGLEIVDKSFQNMSDLPQVTKSLVKDSDAMFVITDNKVASSISLISDILINEKKISVASVTSDVEGGILITNGIDYVSLGRQTGAMAEKILVDKKPIKEIPVEFAQSLTASYNKETLKALGLDENLEAFKNASPIVK